MTLTFHLNGEKIQLADPPATTTLLEYLRESCALTGTKEGCNEGDCGACTVMVHDHQGPRALNACILFLPQLQGTSVTTVEGLAAPDGTLHPVQQALIDHHGSQCGFCTPGFVMSMATAHCNGATDHKDQLAGNLCRCTGYAPILRAAKAVEDAPVPPHLAPFTFSKILRGEAGGLGAEPPLNKTVAEPPLNQTVAESPLNKAAAEPAPLDTATSPFQPQNSDALADLYHAHPKATLVAGATDVGLWVTKGLKQLDPVIFLAGCRDLADIRDHADHLNVGAMVTMNALRTALAPHSPAFDELLRRFASQQIRNAATLGGNIANGSPIGDSPPPLIALGARLILRKGNTHREIALEDFFIEYGRQDRREGEFLERILIPKAMDHLRIYKLSKRFDQDISAVLGAFNICVTDGFVTSAHIAFGGMAATPKRAHHVEQALIGAAWNRRTIAHAKDAFPQDFTPLSDMRASSEYRLETAKNMLERAFYDAPQTVLNPTKVTP